MIRIIKFCDLINALTDLTWVHVYVEYFDCSSGDCLYDKLVTFNYCKGLSADNNYSKYADCEVRFIKITDKLEVCLNYYY